MIKTPNNSNEHLQKYSNDSVCKSFKQRFQRLFHWAPIIALSIIFYIAAVTTNVITHIYHPFSSLLCFFHFIIYLNEFYLVLANYLAASFLGPGFVPINWGPKRKEDKQYLQYCQLCEAYKPPRAHHCRKCDRCVYKMDHHCPWINTCCGHFNHGYFVYFLFFAPLGCIHSAYLLFLTLYYAVFLDFYIQVDYGFVVILTLWEFLLTFFAFGLALGVIIAVGTLWIIQIKSIIKNETGIETWIKTKYELREKTADEPEFIYPYNLGSRYKNLRQVLTLTGRCQGDGITWPVRPGCSQFDMTIEQLKQKRDKDVNSQMYLIKRPYNGSLFPICSQGWRVVFASPCSDEARLPVQPGFKLKVTRWREHWLYGQIVYPTVVVTSNSDNKRPVKPRGWIPKKCAKPFFKHSQDQSESISSHYNNLQSSNGINCQGDSVSKDVAPEKLESSQVICNKQHVKSE